MKLVLKSNKTRFLADILLPFHEKYKNYRKNIRRGNSCVFFSVQTEDRHFLNNKRKKWIFNKKLHSISKMVLDSMSWPAEYTSALFMLWDTSSCSYDVSTKVVHRFNLKKFIHYSKEKGPDAKRERAR